MRTGFGAEKAVWRLPESLEAPKRSRMVGNGPERPETAKLGPEPTRTDIYPYIRDWRARIAATKPSEDEYPCGGVVGVALAWFAAGILVMAAAAVLFIL